MLCGYCWQPKELGVPCRPCAQKPPSVEGRFELGQAKLIITEADGTRREVLSAPAE